MSITYRANRLGTDIEPNRIYCRSRVELASGQGLAKPTDAVAKYVKTQPIFGIIFFF